MGVLRAKLALDEGSWGDLHPSLLGRATNVRTIHVSVGIMVPKRSLVDTKGYPEKNSPPPHCDI